MSSFAELVQVRRSIRKFTDEELKPEELQAILRAALMSPTSKSSRSWHFIVVDEKPLLEKLALCKEAGAAFVADAPLAVVVLGDTAATDVWVEDASIAAVTMQYQATELGLGSCWAQIRNREMADGTPADDVLRFMLGYPQHLTALAIVAFGHPAIERKPQDEDKLKWENVHVNQF
ncbi:MAG: nitroreductase family protein [Bacteroides sp.]|nr:nitroreductase family protein [Roseburia sp.]MCM1347409.1 nitroreductase family protein [Bacteroides sp.]MCM1421878.1 nitroreductase family protein [Bacteroides sp.]